MKTTTAEREVTSNVGERGAFTIKANGKAFKVLIDGLYADKIQSITREIWSNALDAHQMAGCLDRPFDVSFPTAFDPSFRVRDYGVSLTHDQVMHLYTTLFESTKEDTNDQVGKLGLGSKSPFAYTDSFSVTVVLDGQKRFYAAMIGPDSVPTINYMGIEDTDEENGVEVAFPVDKRDVDAFARAAKRISHGFDVKPNVTNMGADQFNGWPELPVMMTGEGWKMLRGNIDGYRSQAYAKMGCVLYPLNANAMGDITQDERDILNHTFVIDFGIGDLEITASREELSYGRNEPTIPSIRARVGAIIEELKATAAQRFAECRTYWEACVLYYSTVHDHSLPDFYRKMYEKYGTWNGKALQKKFPLTRGRGFEVMHFDSKAFSRATVSFRPATANIDLIPQKNTVFLLEDLTMGRKVKRASARVRLWREATKSKQAVWIRFHSHAQMSEVLPKLMETYDGAEFIDIESIELPVVERSNAPRRPVMPRVFDGNSFDDCVELDEEDFEEGGIFVSLERMNPVIPAGASQPRTVINYLVRLGVISKDTPIYGAPKSLRKNFEGEQWVDLYDFAREWLAENGKDAPVIQAREHAVSVIRTDSTLRYIRDHVAVEKIGNLNSPVLEVEALFDMAVTVRDMEAKDIFALANALGKRLDGNEHHDGLLDLHSDLVARLHAAYPLLATLVRRVSYDDNLVDLLTQYVNMCDTVSETNHVAQFQIAAE